MEGGVGILRVIGSFLGFILVVEVVIYVLFVRFFVNIKLWC